MDIATLLGPAEYVEAYRKLSRTLVDDVEKAGIERARLVYTHRGLGYRWLNKALRREWLARTTVRAAESGLALQTAQIGLLHARADVAAQLALLVGA